MLHFYERINDDDDDDDDELNQNNQETEHIETQSNDTQDEALMNSKTHSETYAKREDRHQSLRDLVWSPLARKRNNSKLYARANVGTVLTGEQGTDTPICIM